ncbi:hypothetical protein N9878_02510 [bacterium]|nr:hypothetical protein [bacterium]
MKTEIVTVMVYKVVIFTCILFQIDNAAMLLAQIDPTIGMDIYKIVSNFGIVGFLILAIKYFISESKRMQEKFSQDRTEQAKQHSMEKGKLREIHDKEILIQALKNEKLQEEVLELKLELAKFNK